jgi:hypothetical protein
VHGFTCVAQPKWVDEKKGGRKEILDFKDLETKTKRRPPKKNARAEEALKNF